MEKIQFSPLLSEESEELDRIKQQNEDLFQQIWWASHPDKHTREILRNCLLILGTAERVNKD